MVMIKRGADRVWTRRKIFFPVARYLPPRALVGKIDDFYITFRKAKRTVYVPMTPVSDGAGIRRSMTSRSESMKIKPGPVAGSDRATAGKVRLSRTTRNDAWGQYQQMFTHQMSTSSRSRDTHRAPDHPGSRQPLSPVQRHFPFRRGSQLRLRRSSRCRG